MSLLDYLKERGIGPYGAHRMAGALNLSSVRLGHYAMQKRRVPLEIAIAIEDLTRGKVSVRDLVTKNP